MSWAAVLWEPSGLMIALHGGIMGSAICGPFAAPGEGPAPLQWSPHKLRPVQADIS